MKSFPSLSRPAAFLGAAAIALITSAVVTRATTTLTTPNASVVFYTLAAGANSAPIGLAQDAPVLLMGVHTTIGNRGVGQATLLAPSIAPQFIEWTGIESPAAAAITSGFSSVAGTHILYLDFAHTVDIEVNTANTIRVHNGSAATATGRVVLFF